MHYPKNTIKNSKKGGTKTAIAFTLKCPLSSWLKKRLICVAQNNEHILVTRQTNIFSHFSFVVIVNLWTSPTMNYIDFMVSPKSC